MQALIKELVIRWVEHKSEIHSNESQHLAEGTEVARLGWRSSFVLQQALSFRTRDHLCRQGVALASTRQLRSQGPVSVHAHRTEGVTGSEGREGANVGGIGVGDVTGDGNGSRAGTRTGVEANEGAQHGNEDKDGDGNGEDGGKAKKRMKPRKSCRRDQALSFRTRHHLCRQGVALAGTQKLRSQGPGSVHARRTEGVTGSEGGEEADGDVNVDGDGDGSGTRTGVEANEET